MSAATARWRAATKHHTYSSDMGPVYRTGDTPLAALAALAEAVQEGRG